MNCFYYTIKAKTLKRLFREDLVLTIPVYQQEVMPEEGDRVYFNNFEDVFSIEKVSPSLEEAELIEAYHIDEFTRPYLQGFFDLALYPICTDIEIVSLADMFANGKYEEISPVDGDVYFLLSKFDAELKIAEAESEGKSKVSESDRESLIMEASGIAAQTFYGEIMPTIARKKYETTTDGRIYRIRYNPSVAYLEGCIPIAVILYYGEEPLEDGEVIEQIPAAYVDWDLAENYGLTVEEVQYIVEELFDYVMLDFRPDSAEAILNTPTIMLASSQVSFYEGLIDRYGWENTSDVGFGYQLFN